MKQDSTTGANSLTMIFSWEKKHKEEKYDFPALAVVPSWVKQSVEEKQDSDNKDFYVYVVI